MLGRRSPDLSLFNPEPERIFKTRTPTITMVEDLPTAKPMKKYFTPSTNTSVACIYIPNMDVNHYEIKSNMIQLLPSFYELTNDDPYKYLDEFLEIYSTIKIQNFSDDALRLTLFPFSSRIKPDID